MYVYEGEYVVLDEPCLSHRLIADPNFRSGESCRQGKQKSDTPLGGARLWGRTQKLAQKDVGQRPDSKRSLMVAA